ncbi:MAG: hypothetical protein AAGH79_16240 [Bacteroidota bacterium]
MRVHWLLLALLVTLLTACDKGELPAKTIVGEWEWLSSIGGFVPVLQNPDTEGYERIWEITERHVFEYRNEEEFSKERYSISTETRKDGTPEYWLSVKNDFMYTWEIRNDSLILYDACTGCGVHYYKRK